jgi:DNA-binding MarR family transcriptional regulator
MVTAWLDPREAAAWRGYQRVRQQLTGHLGRNLAAKCDLSLSDYELLVVLTEAPGMRMRFRDLGHLVGWERSRLSRQVARMDQRGLLERQRCPADGRGIDVVVTARGLAAIEAAAPIQLEAVRHCFIDVLTEDQLDALGQIMAAISAHLSTEHAEVG